MVLKPLWECHRGKVSTKFLCIVFILLCTLFYMKTRKHACFQVFSPFSAYFSPNYIIAEKGLAEAFHSCYWLYTYFLHSSQFRTMVGTKSTYLTGLGFHALKVNYCSKCLDRHLEKPIKHRRQNSTQVNYTHSVTNCHIHCDVHKMDDNLWWS